MFWKLYGCFLMNYSEKLKDPRWQKKRLQILERDNFTCRNCNKDDIELVVHHLKYFRGREPWEYADKYLITLCTFCHKAEKYLSKENITTWLIIFENDFYSKIICFLKMAMRKITRKIQTW